MQYRSHPRHRQAGWAHWPPDPQPPSPGCPKPPGEGYRGKGSLPSKSRFFSVFAWGVVSWDRGQRSSDLLGNRNSVRMDGAESYVDDCGLALAWGKVNKAGPSPSGTRPFWIRKGEGVLAYLWTPERPVRSPVCFWGPAQQRLVSRGDPFAGPNTMTQPISSWRAWRRIRASVSSWTPRSPLGAQALRLLLTPSHSRNTGILYKRNTCLSFWQALCWLGGDTVFSNCAQALPIKWGPGPGGSEQTNGKKGGTLSQASFCRLLRRPRHLFKACIHPFLLRPSSWAHGRCSLLNVEQWIDPVRQAGHRAHARFTDMQAAAC